MEPSRWIDPEVIARWNLDLAWLGGLTGLAVGALVLVVASRWRPTPELLASAAATAAAVLLWQQRLLDAALAVAIAVCAFAPRPCRRDNGRASVASIAVDVAAGAVVLFVVAPEEFEHGVVVAAAVLAAVAAGAMAGRSTPSADLRGAADWPSSGVALETSSLAVASVALFVAVPDTERPIVLASLAVAVAVVVLVAAPGVGRRWRSTVARQSRNVLPRSANVAPILMVALVGGLGYAPRPHSATAMLAAVVVVSGPAFLSGTTVRHHPVAAWAALAASGALCLLAARTVGVGRLDGAGTLGGVMLTAGAASPWVLTARLTRPARSGH